MSDIVALPVRTKLWQQGLGWLLLLAPLFFLSYSQLNAFTASRADVGSMVLSWEHHIPFIPWTIVPYWSIDLLYAMSLFICTTRQELTRHAYRLAAASVIACSGFLLFPLTFTFPRPDSPGILGWLFHQLEQFDLPYNQAPSLHIILTWLLWLRFHQHLSRVGRAICNAWFLLIAVSVLTTWQHHFIDVASGFIVGVVISYVIPVSSRWRWQRVSSRSANLAIKYCAASGVLCWLSWAVPYGWILLWAAFSVFMVAAGYIGLGVSIFQKNREGNLSLSANLLLKPYLVAAKIAQRWYSRDSPAFSPIIDGVSVGRFPNKNVLHTAVLDLTAEFHRKNSFATHWSAIPLMDLIVPNQNDIQRAVCELKALRESNEAVLVCCALGLSRSAMVVAAWLMASSYAASSTQAIELIKKQRPQIVLTPAHVRALQQYEESLCKMN